MAQLTNSTTFASPGNQASFSITIPAVQAGAKLVCVTYGGATVQAAIGGSNFTKRTSSLNTMEVVCQDITAVGGETSVDITLNGGENIDGMIFEFAPGTLGAFAWGEANNATIPTDKQSIHGSVTTTGPALIFTAVATVDVNTDPARQWWGHEPLGKVALNRQNTGVGSTKFWGQIGLSDVAGAGTYTPRSSRAVSGTSYQAASWAYDDTSGVPTYANPYANAIEAENSLPGSESPTWFGAVTHANIAGYTDKISYLPGETVNFKVDSNNIGFTVEINRTGFYNYVTFGGKRKADITGSPTVQPAPTIDAYGGTVCAWSTTATWATPSDITPGVYIANIRRDDNSAFVAQIIFIIRSPTPSTKQNKIMVKTADFTWQAYNVWGGSGEAGIEANFTGRSLYTQAPAGGATTSRAFAVSYDRPSSISSTKAQTTFLDSEISIINFLEGNGYDIDYYSCADIDIDPTIPSKYQVAVAMGHDEYWTPNLWSAFADARDKGTNIMSFSANTALWHVRFDPSDTGRRTMICYKDSHDTVGWDGITKYDPVEYTGTWRDTRTNIGGVNNPWRQPESELFGQWFIANGPQSLTMVVPDTYKDLPIWRNTAVTSLGSGASQTLYAGSIGYEWDYVKTNEPTTPKNLVLLQEQDISITGKAANDDGDNYSGNGTFRYGMSLYLAPSGAMVFGAGTWRWGWGISRYRASSTDTNGPIDIVMQQATINLLKDLGMSPATILTTAQNNDATALVDPGEARTPEDYGLSVERWGNPIG